MATTPTLQQLNTLIVNLTARVVALEAVKPVWRAPMLAVASWPKQGDTSGSVSWSKAAGANVPSVAYSLDGAPPVATTGSISFSGLQAGIHTLQLFVGGAATPELSHSWVTQ